MSAMATTRTMHAQSPHPLRVLVRHSSVPKDIYWAKEIAKHLAGAERLGAVEVWSDERLFEAGDDRRLKIDRAIQQADIVLLLLSADLLASDILHNVELPKLMARHEEGTLVVIPVVLRACLWRDQPWLGDLAPNPSDGSPLASLKTADRDRALAALAQSLVALRVPQRTSWHGAPQLSGLTTSPRATSQSDIGPTYNVHIHGPTGPIGIGDGATGAGKVVTVAGAHAPTKDGYLRVPLWIGLAVLSLAAITIVGRLIAKGPYDGAPSLTTQPSPGASSATQSYSASIPVPVPSVTATAAAPDSGTNSTTAPVAPNPAPTCLTPKTFADCQRGCAAKLASELAGCHGAEACLASAKNRNQDLCLPRCEASRCR